jgi:threonine aldolase
MKLKIDLFSDTNVNPSTEMRLYMSQAEVGNEVAGEDPTVNQLIEKVCTLLGKEAGVFLPSGTMCNGVSYRVFCNRPGDAIILDETAHPLHMSSGLIGGLVHAIPLTIKGDRGIFNSSQLKQILDRPKGRNLSRFRVLSIEQTTNFGGGAVWPLETIQDVCTLAHHHELYCHLDGARLLNACIATGIPPNVYAASFDAVWIDFAKGLGAPMGAILVGNESFIEEAWYYKFQQGGGMHQAGIVAAGCLYALEHNLNRLAEDHKKAKLLANLLSTLPEIEIDPALTETNIVLFKVKIAKWRALEMVDYLLKKQIRVHAINTQTVRCIIHADIKEGDIYIVFDAIKEFLTKVKGWKE